jgi:hypothetical protein
MVGSFPILHEDLRKKLGRIRSKSAQTMYKKILQALAFSNVLEDLSPTDCEKLTVYLRGVNRIVRCREAAQRVTKSGWHNVANCLLQTRSPLSQMPQEEALATGSSHVEPVSDERQVSFQLGFVTEMVKRSLQAAVREVKRMNHEYIGTEHILLGLAKEESCLAGLALAQVGISSQMIHNETTRIVQQGPDDAYEPSGGRYPLTPRAKKVIENSRGEATKARHKYLGTEHLLLGCIVEREGVAAQVLLNLGAKEESIRHAIGRNRSPGF